MTIDLLSPTSLILLAIEADLEAQLLQQCLEPVEKALAFSLSESQEEAEVDLVMVFVNAVFAKNALVSCEQRAEGWKVCILGEADDVVEELNV